MKDLLILPAYNEEDTLAQTVSELQGLPDSFELVVVNIFQRLRRPRRSVDEDTWPTMR